MENSWRFFKKLNIGLSYDLAILLPGIYLEKIIIQKDTCTPVFTAALFTITKTQKQPKYPTHEWIKKMWFKYTTEYYSAIKKEIEPFAVTWMDLEIIILSEVSQTEKRQISYDITCMWSLKIWHKWTYLQNRNKTTCNKREKHYSAV